MKNRLAFYNIIIVLLITLSLTSCELVGDIFKAGMWTAVIGMVLVVGLVFWLFSRFRG